MRLSTTKPAIRRALCINGKRRLFHRVLEALCSAELRYAHCGDLDALTCARVAARACGASLRGEDAEACDRHFIAGLEAAGNRVDHGLYRALRIRLGATKHLMHFRYDVSFVHAV